MRRLLLALLLAPGFAQAQSLPDLVREALASDPAIAAAEAQVRAAQERVVQAKAAFGPTVTGTADAAHSTYNDYLAPEARRFKSNSIGVEITQPIVHNDLIFAHDSAAAQLEQAQAAVDQAREEAQAKFVEACFEVLKARDDVRFLQAQKAATAEQLDAARHSFKAGTVAIPDVREAEAKADTVAAQLVGAQFDLEMREQVLAELAGHPVPGLLGRGLDGAHMPPLAQWCRDLDLIGVHRHLKVLGIFARLKHRDAKPKYVADAPRFIGYLDAVLPRHPQLAPLAALIDARVRPAMAGLAIAPA